MNIIDLSIPLYDGMPVYHDDPEVSIKSLYVFEKDEWNMRRLEINSHEGTHVNVPIHATADGKNLDNYTLETFMGKSVKYESDDDIQEGMGVLFDDVDIDQRIGELIVERKPKFVGLSTKFWFDIEVERYLLREGVISFERLTNIDKLPEEFMFYGMPLSIKEGDGSPVRAFAILE